MRIILKRTVRGAAFACAALGTTCLTANADELSTLKLELSALKDRINTLEYRAPSAQQVSRAEVSNHNMISIQRGTNTLSDWHVDRPGESMPDTRGVTIAITPTADLPAPLHEVTLSGYVKGDFIYDFNQNLGDFFSYSAIARRPKHSHARLHARQTRFRVQSRSETAVGEIRTLIEGNFMSGGTYGDTDFALRHAWGEWDMTPNFTLGVGQTWRNFMSPFTGITTVDLNGPAGLIGTSRAAQIRLTYTNGPSRFAVSIEDPTGWREWFHSYNVHDMPDISARWEYDVPGGSQFLVSGVVRHYNVKHHFGAVTSADSFGWAIQGAANINLADYAMFSTSVIYGDGVGNYINGNAPGFWLNADNGKLSTIESLGIFAGIGANITDQTSINLGWGLVMPTGKDIRRAADYSGLTSNHLTKGLMSIHGNIIWKPVNELQLGWELMYAEREYYDMADDGRHKNSDNLRGQFGAWFFF